MRNRAIGDYSRLLESAQSTREALHAQTPARSAALRLQPASLGLGSLAPLALCLVCPLRIEQTGEGIRSSNEALV
jgi:hypothetical protein